MLDESSAKHQLEFHLCILTPVRSFGNPQSVTISFRGESNSPFGQLVVHDTAIKLERFARPFTPRGIGFSGAFWSMKHNSDRKTGSLKWLRGTAKMTNKKSKKSEDGVKRFLTDFRSHVERRSFEERRSGERRSGEIEVDNERRTSDDRRDKYDRRETLLDRRRGTPEVFIREHIDAIRQALQQPDAEVACPRCEGELLLGPTIQRGEVWVREVHCIACRHRMVIPDVARAVRDMTEDESD